MPNLVISGMAADAELLLDDDLGRQPVAVPAEATLDSLAAHRLVARHGVLDEAGQQMAVVRQSVGERRAVVEHVLLGIGASTDRLGERVALRPRRPSTSVSIAGNEGCGSTSGYICGLL